LKNFKYEIILFWSEENKSYIAKVPELPGCMLDGKTYEETLKNVKKVIEEWIKTAVEIGKEIPVPKEKKKEILKESLNNFTNDFMDNRNQPENKS
jgi:predicted RNase H-like HicB family nuclease